MRGNFTTILFIFLLTGAVKGQNFCQKNIIGIWDFIHTRDSASIQFMDSVNVCSIYRGFRMPCSTYKINFAVHPNLLTLITIDNGIKREVKNLIEFVNIDTLKIQVLTSRDKTDRFADVSGNKIGFLVRRKNSP